MNLSTVKWAQWDETQSRELLGLFICVCIALCAIVAHNIAQNRPDSFPPYPPDNHHCSDDVYLREGGRCHCHSIISCYSKIQNGLPFWCQLTQVFLEIRPLNGYSTSSYCSYETDAYDRYNSVRWVSQLLVIDAVCLHNIYIYNDRNFVLCSIYLWSTYYY